MVAPLGERTHDELARLVPELLLAGHLIDRAGMPHLIAAFGLEPMRDIAIDEWMGASPIYTQRMQRALRFEGDSVETMFKGMQLDIGAPPQFMDFRYALHDHDHGEFWLDHCGALMDVEPMGDDFVVAMCHDIEDPTFDATVTATNAWAQVRPIHRPPRTPADRHPHCHWRVDIDTSHDPLTLPPITDRIRATEAASVLLADPTASDDEPGATDYSGSLLEDLLFEGWSRSTLVRIAEEVCLQGHLLVLAFRDAVRQRAESDEQATAIVRKQFTGIAGVAAERLHAALDLDRSLEAVATVFELHPAFHPRAYVGLDLELTDRLLVTVRPGPSGIDGAWPSLLDPDHLEPLDALVRAVDPRLRCSPLVSAGDVLTVEVVTDEEPAEVCEEVVLTRFSTGTDFRFEERSTPVEVRAR